MKHRSLHDYLDKQQQVGNDCIENDMQANSIIRKYEQLREKKELNKLIARTELDRIKKWRDEVNRELDREMKQYRMQIYQYISRLRQETQNPSLNKLKLPYGTVTFQSQKTRWHYDEEYLINYFLQTNQLHFLRIELNKENMRKYFNEANTTIYDPKTGKILKGVTVERQGEYFYVKRK